MNVKEILIRALFSCDNEDSCAHKITVYVKYTETSEAAPIRAQFPGHVITLDQSEARVHYLIKILNIQRAGYLHRVNDCYERGVTSYNNHYVPPKIVSHKVYLLPRRAKVSKSISLW